MTSWRPLGNPTQPGIKDPALKPWQKLDINIQDGLVDKKQGNFKQSPPFTWTGTLAAGSGAPRWTAPEDGTIVEVRATANTAPTGAAIICDVNKNGTTIFTTQANRPTIAVSTNTITAVPDDVTVTTGDYFQVDIDQVGSTVAGSDLVVQITYQTPGLGSDTITGLKGDTGATGATGAAGTNGTNGAVAVIKEVDGTPSGSPGTLKFPNGSLTDNGDGSYTITFPSGLASPLTTKGDIWVYSTADTRLGVGANGTRIEADSSATPGLAWVVQSYAHVYRNSAQNLTSGSFTQVNFDSVDSQSSDSPFDATTNHNFTCKRAGRYSVTGAIAITATALTGLVAVSCFKNASEHKRQLQVQTATWAAFPLAFQIKAALNDTLDIRVFQSNGGNIALATGSLVCHAEFSYLGA